MYNPAISDHTLQLLMSAEFNIGDTVTVKVDPEQTKYIIVGILITPNELVYRLSNAEGSTKDFYGIELV